MYIVVEQGLKSGLKLPQAIHAFRQFIEQHPEIDEIWYAGDKNVIVLEQCDIEDRAQWLEGRGYKVARFYEPDLGNLLTAICVEPNGGRHLGHLKLAA